MPEGTEAAQPSPPNVAAVITLKTDKAGRDQVANKHLGAVPLGFYVAGILTEDAINVYDNVAASLTNTIPVSNGADEFDLIPVIYHRSGLTTSDTITQRQVNNTVRVMRRRTVGLGT